ncbi:LuxR family transcriptional regulator [Aquabacterium sp. A7-Y]|uniref:helix-turn-helix transcriptional regulator n=1 Tax=Aquabacterium sp. A7-Y TaxID=1349605 RepID=UPI00223D9960|nr:LuxR family transcriptional regulator [Aquabacterium sp. A7-Y]MCW7537055.1 LuxR family transcriptional regulator [Aquabacterium sp. A7-Y]
MHPVLAELCAAEDFVDRRRVVHSALAALGLSTLGYICMTWIGKTPTPLAACTAHEDPGWVRRYIARHHCRVDPRLRHAASAALPLMWQTEGLAMLSADARPSAALLEFIAELGATGTGSGLTLSLPGDSGRERYFITLTSSADTTDMLRDVLGPAVVLALAVHDFYTCHCALPTHAKLRGAPLTPLYRRIMQALLQGLPDKEIAATLALTRSNLDYHMRQLRKRFGAHNRLQLLQAMKGATDAPAPDTAPGAPQRQGESPARSLTSPPGG